MSIMTFRRTVCLRGRFMHCWKQLPLPADGDRMTEGRPTYPALRRFQFAGMLVQPAGVDQDLRCAIEMLAHQSCGEIYIPREHPVLDLKMLLLYVAISVPQRHGEPPISLGLLVELPANAQQMQDRAGGHEGLMELRVGRRPLLIELRIVLRVALRDLAQPVEGGDDRGLPFDCSVLDGVPDTQRLYLDARFGQVEELVLGHGHGSVALLRLEKH